MPPRRLLLVEDTAADAMLVRFYLRQYAHPMWEVTHVLTVEAAQEALRPEALPYNLLLLDLGLPGTTGISALAALHRLYSCACMPIIVLSNADEEAMHCTALGAGFVTKTAMVNNAAGFVQLLEEAYQNYLKTRSLLDAASEPSFPEDSHA